MVKLIVDSTYLDMFGDETITLTKRSKDANELDKIFADYSNTFTVPASQVNNKVFKHYYKFNVIGGYDARIKTPARLELNNETLQDGLLRLDECVLKDGKVDQYKVTFYGNTVNLSDLFGKNTLADLNLSEFDHVKDITNVSNGLSWSGDVLGSSGSLLNNDIIYPLISKDRKWTAKDLTQTSAPYTDVQPKELSPAIRVKSVIDKIATDYNLTFTSDFFDEAHFNNIYLWCPRGLEASDEALIDVRGNQMPFQDPIGTFVNDIQNFSQGILSLNGFYSGGFTVGRNAVNITPSDLGASYTVKMYGRLNTGEWISETETTTTGAQLFNFEWNDTDTYTQVRWYIESPTAMTADYTFDIRYAKTSGGAETSAIDDPSAGVNTMDVNTYANQMKYKIPSMLVIDFFGGILKMFNLMITPLSSTSFDIEPYDVWVTEGITRDLTNRVEFDTTNIITPKLPKEVAYRYSEPKGISNNKFMQLFGVSYGDLEARTDGGDQPKNVNVEFENLLWDLLTDQPSSLLTGFSFEEPDNGGFQDKSFLMYLNSSSQSPGTSPIVLGTGGSSVSISQYKACSSYYPLTTPTHTLNFGSEINPFDYATETVSLFDLYHDEYIQKIFHEAMRLHKVSMHLPTHIMREIDIKDVIKLDDVYYNINSMMLNLSKETASFELINFVRELSVIVPPIDNEAPIIGELWVVQNPDVTAPTIGTLSASNITGDSITLNWTAATDDVGVDQYDIYQDTVLIKSKLGSVNTALITGLSNDTEYDFYITASDAAGNTSSASNTVTETTLDVNAPVVTSPSTVWWYVPVSGANHSYQITATNTPNLYEATGLPGFLSLNTSSGLISGLVGYTDNGSYNIQVRASNNAGGSWGEYKEVVIVVIQS